jgi:hypothetical protein
MFISSILTVRNRAGGAVKCGLSVRILIMAGMLMSAFAQDGTSFLVPPAPFRFNSIWYWLDALRDQRSRLFSSFWFLRTCRVLARVWGIGQNPPVARHVQGIFEMDAASLRTDRNYRSRRGHGGGSAYIPCPSEA